MSSNKAEVAEQSNPQAEHYARIHDAYQAHYYDGPSQAYRERFIYRPLFEGQNLHGKRVAELACGSGYNARYVKENYQPAVLWGLDISEPACAEYGALVGEPALCLDLTKPLPEATQPFDVLYVIGGLHHCVINLPQTLANAAALLKPGGTLLVMEPNAGFCLQTVRDWWYRKDQYFDHQTERALTPEEIAAASAGALTLERLEYVGGPAYFIIINSLILRVPRVLKPLIAKPLFALESLYQRLPGRALFPAFIAHYRRA